MLLREISNVPRHFTAHPCGVALAIRKDRNDGHPPAASTDSLELGIGAVFGLKAARFGDDDVAVRIDQNQAGATVARFRDVSFTTEGQERSVDDQKVGLVDTGRTMVNQCSFAKAIWTRVSLRCRKRLIPFEAETANPAALTLTLPMRPAARHWLCFRTAASFLAPTRR